VNKRGLVALGGVLLAGAVAFLAFQALRIWPTVSAKLAVRGLYNARMSGDLGKTEKAARSLVRQRPADGPLRLLLSRTVFDRGDFGKAEKAYGEAAKRSRSPSHRAAAEVGRGAALLLKSSPPASDDVAAAIETLEKAANTRSASGDARALLAVAHIWAGDLDAARAAAEAAATANAEKGTKGGLGLGPSASLACARAYLAGVSGDAAKALQELERARMLLPSSDTPVGEYLSSVMKAFELETASRPGASTALRSKLVKHLQSEGPKGIADEKTYPLFFRAAYSCALSPLVTENRIGMDFLSRAVAARPKDPMPLVATAAALARKAEPLWESSAAAAKAAAAKHGADYDARATVIDLLLEGRRGVAVAAPAGDSLKKLDSLGAKIDECLTKAAALYAASDDEDGARRALAIHEYLFRWHLRASELCTRRAERRERELVAASRAMAVKKLLGERIPRTKAAARLLRNAGALFAGHAAWEKAGACFTESLELFGDQPNLKPYSESMRKRPSVVAVYPSKAGELQAGPPLAGIEIAMPKTMAGLRDCKIEASVGTGDGPRKAVTPVISGTGLWYVPGEGEVPDGLVEVRFAVTDPSGYKIEAKTSFRVDSSPPEITSRFPEPGAVVTNRQTVFRIGWRDPSGIAPESVQVVLEPVAAEGFFRRILVDKGLQKSGRFSGAETWKSKAPVIQAGASEGTIVTGTMSALPPGVFRVQVRMRDAMDKVVKDAWKFTVR